MQKIFLISFLVLNICLIRSSCNSDSVLIREAVMQEDMTIKAKTQNGELIVSAGKGANRSYTWDGQTINVKLIPRSKRWGGKLGLLDGNDIRPPHEKVVHVVIEECQLHFSSVQDAISRMNTSQQDEDLYRDDGLLIRFRKRVHPKNGKIAILISIHQIMINGKKPSNLRGSQNERINVTQNDT